MSDIAARFAREIADHQMTVLHDDGLYRHLRFQRQAWRPPLLHPQRSSFYWFELITVPGSLIFRGDGERPVPFEAPAARPEPAAESNWDALVAQRVPSRVVASRVETVRTAGGVL